MIGKAPLEFVLEFTSSALKNMRVVLNQLWLCQLQCTWDNTILETLRKLLEGYENSTVYKLIILREEWLPWLQAS